jgi:protein-tyrosine phosphatase
MKTIYWLDGPWPGRLAIVARPRGEEWLSDEIRHWRRSGIDIVVSLLTLPESSELGLSQEAVLSTQQSICFLSFPIPDRAVPSSLAEMQIFLGQIHGLLAQGKHVAIHCRQGIGRSALFAASLLVYGGVDVALAFRQIESARGAAVPDTLEQRRWVEKFASLIATPTPNFAF